MGHPAPAISAARKAARSVELQRLGAVALSAVELTTTVERFDAARDERRTKASTQKRAATDLAARVHAISARLAEQPRERQRRAIV